MKKYIITENTNGIKRNYYLHAPNLESIKKWITESKKLTIYTTVTNPSGAHTIYTTPLETHPPITYTVEKWEEPKWITI
jgi:hypothetical protein